MKNKTPKFILTLLTAAAISCVAFSNQAQAVPINGDIQFQGTVTADHASAPAVVTTVTFVGPFQVIGTAPENGINNYSTVPNGTIAAFAASLSFTGEGLSAVLNGALMPLWTFTIGTTTYSFDLLSLSAAVVGGVSGGNAVIALTGSGISHITGFTDTLASWSLQGSTANGFVFQLSSNTTASGGVGVPDGGATVALLGLSIVALWAVRRNLAPALNK
jgi:hypothetical protein